MLGILGALLPIFGLVVLGFLLKTYRFPQASFWPEIDKVTYYILFPALLVNKLATAQLDRPELVPMALVMMGSILVVALLVALIRPLFSYSAAAYTSILQGSIRPNTYVGLAGAVVLYGNEGLALTAVALASVIPLVNIISVSAFGLWLPKGRASLGAVFVNLLKNPLILACLTGILLNVLHATLVFGLDSITEILGRAALAMGLLSVGAGLQIRALSTQAGPLVISSLAKLLLLPGLVWLSGCYFGLEGLPLRVVILYASLPCSVSSYTLAAQLGGDKELVAAIITLQTMLAALTIPGLVFLSA